MPDNLTPVPPEAPSERIPPTEPVMRKVVIGLIIYTLIVLAVVSFIIFGHASINQRAAIGMMLVVLVVWAVIGGTLTLIYKDRVRAFVLRLPGSWKLKFFIFATVMCLLEEVCTTTMTNLAPLFGVKIGEAYITASTNYLDVVLGHSVIVLFPHFLVWAWFLSKYRFSPAMVFLLYGITGGLAEMSMGGPGSAVAGFWIFIYGLMVYLPAYCIPYPRDVKSPKWWVYPMVLILPLLSSGPMAGLVMLLHPIQPSHFPPIH